MPRKIDLYAKHKKEYVAPKSPVLVKMGPAQYLTIDGQGTPGGERFTAAIGALYGAAFTIKMARKFAGKQDYAVAKLEALWPGDLSLPRDQWHWTLMIRTPAFVTASELKKAVATLIERGKSSEVKKVKLRAIKEGQCVQMLHVGPYEAEGPTWDAMEDFAERQRLSFAGAHHEIYLSDPRRVAPAKLKTILRKPVRKK
jgi:hypothetical protein